MADPPAEPTPAEAPKGPAPPQAARASATSERMFRDRLIKALTRLNIRDLRAMWREELFEPHMHLFLMLMAAFAVGLVIYVAEPLLI